MAVIIFLGNIRFYLEYPKSIKFPKNIESQYLLKLPIIELFKYVERATSSAKIF